MTNYQFMARRLASMTEELASIVNDLLSDARPQVGEFLAGIKAQIRTTGNDAFPEETPDGPADEPWNRIETVPVEAPPPAPGYALPLPPPQEYRVVDANGRKWTHSKDEHGLFYQADIPHPFHNELGQMVPPVMRWAMLLESYGPVTIDTTVTPAEAETARLYGPPGARWGDPDAACSHYACTLGYGHIGPHLDAAGDPIGQTEADGSTVDAGITPAESSKTPCLCGEPYRHAPTCPRYARTSGTATQDEALREFEVLEFADLKAAKEE